MYYLDDEVLYRAVVPAALVLVCAASLEAADSEAAFFATRIRPLLAHNCFACHTDSRLGGQCLDSREAVLHREANRVRPSCSVILTTVC